MKGAAPDVRTQSPALTPFEQIDTLTIDQIESARFTASFFDEELAPVTTALLLDSGPIKADAEVEVAKLKSDLLTAHHAGQKTDTSRNEARTDWKRLERRDSYTSPWQPAWMQRLIGDEYFQELKSISFHGKPTDDQLAPVENFDRLMELKFADAENITDSGLVHLAGLTQLRRLDIEGVSGITDNGLAFIAKLAELRDLSLNSPAITDAGVAQLARLRHLQKLRIRPLTDAGLAHLTGLTELLELNLVGSDISDAGLAWLNDLKNPWVSDTEVAAARAATPGLVILREGRPLF